MGLVIILVIVFCCVYNGALCYIIADKLNRDKSLWSFLGTFFGPFATLFLVTLGKQDLSSYLLKDEIKIWGYLAVLVVLIVPFVWSIYYMNHN